MKTKAHSSSRLMRLLMRINPNLEHMYMYFRGTIYHPDGRPPDATIIEHESVHLEQERRLGWFFYVAYLLLPLPIGLAWFRWRLEREAYLVDIRAGRHTVDSVVEALGSARYGWAWPRPLMRKWFDGNT